MKSVLEFKKAKQSARKISMLTSYDSWSAKIIEASPIDCILVGDSCMMTMHGQHDTVRATVDIMATHTRAVRAGAPTKFVIADMPFMAHRKSTAETIEAVRELIAVGANAVKIEGVQGSESEINYIIESGVPVMGHLGLTPQSIHGLGGFRVQATDDEAAKKLMLDAETLERLGVFALVLECVPSKIAALVSQSLKIPTIGIGAGSDCDGQVLVFQDLIGADPTFKPKFVRKYINSFELISGALKSFTADIQNQSFPSPDESFSSEKKS
jgi:3-methyl-2-oxobutanoate hydroxymethyltransferase